MGFNSGFKGLNKINYFKSKQIKVPSCSLLPDLRQSIVFEASWRSPFAVWLQQHLKLH